MLNWVKVEKWYISEFGPPVIDFEDGGCGCCAYGPRKPFAEETIPDIEKHIENLQDEIKLMQDLIEEIRANKA